MGGRVPSGNPFMPFGPQGFMQQQQNTNPFANPMATQTKPLPNPFGNQNLDEYVKMLDKKIAELEEEEKRENEKNKQPKEEPKKEEPVIKPEITENKPAEVKNPITIDTTSTILGEDKPEIERVEKPKLDVDVDKIPVKDNAANEEFFDDFFGDEDE